MSETRNLGELFQEAIKINLTEKQKNRTYTQRKPYNTTGIISVSVVKCPGCTQGFIYQFSRTIHGSKTVFRSVDILKLKGKVLSGGFEWEIFSEDLARKTAQEAGITYEELIA